MKKLTFTLYFLLVIIVAHAQSRPSHIIYDSGGKKVSYGKMMKTVEKSDFLFFGELHDNPIAHWLQLEVTQDLHDSRPLILGAEMFEADDQVYLNKYLAGTITYNELDSLARLWKNYETDYAPLVDFAKDNKLAFIATNVPRRYANMVYKYGFDALDTLSTQEKSWIAPLPIAFNSELPGYKNILEMMGDHGSPKLVMAQALKDATMAYFILKNYKEGHQFIHFNGAYHSNNYEGILWYLELGRPGVNYTTISTVSQEDISSLVEENKNIADFIICIDEDMTTTY